MSRNLVVDAVLAVLEQKPDEVLSIAGIAREVEAVPAALYRHFESLDDLLDGDAPFTFVVEQVTTMVALRRQVSRQG